MAGLYLDPLENAAVFSFDKEELEQADAARLTTASSLVMLGASCTEPVRCTVQFRTGGRGACRFDLGLRRPDESRPRTEVSMADNERYGHGKPIAIFAGLASESSIDLSYTEAASFAIPYRPPVAG